MSTMNIKSPHPDDLQSLFTLPLVETKCEESSNFFEEPSSMCSIYITSGLIVTAKYINHC